ncbi:MAG: hypothetical protein AB7E32_11715 [Desulfovibrio sp.]
MSEFDHFADNLADEVLSEMADNFFGARRAMDDQIERFQKLARELKKIQEQVEHYAEILHFVLLGEEGAAGFYEAVGLDPGSLPLCLECTLPPRLEKIPFAFTVKGRFRKLVRLAYQSMRDSVQDYLRGHEYADPDEPRRRRVSVHYKALKQMERRVNTQIEKLNRQNSLTNTLHYVHGLNPAALERENIAGAPGFVDPANRDAEFKYALQDTEAEGLKEFPEMPAYGDVRQEIGGFVDAFYARNSAEIRNMLERLREALKSSSR